MVQVLPGAGELLAQPMEQFAKGLEDYLKPNMEFQKAMQKAVGSNPQLAQQLADLEYNAPGSLSNMGFGDLGKVIARIPESPESQVKRTNRGEVVGNEKGALDLTEAQQGLSIARINDTIHYLKTAGPMVHADDALRMLGMPTAGETKMKEAETEEMTQRGRSAKITADVNEATAPGAIAKAKLEYQSLEDVMNKYPQLHGMNPMGMVRTMMSGGDVPNFQDYMNLPGGREAIMTAQAIYSAQLQRDERDLTRAMHGEQMSALEKQQIIQAGSFQRTTKASTIPAWRTVLEHPDQVEEIKKLDPTTLSQQQRDILEASQAQDVMQQNLENKDVNTLSFNARQAHYTAADAIKKAESQAGIDFALVPLNNTLAELGQKTGQRYQARYGPVPDIGSSEPGTRFFGMANAVSQIYYVDNEGKRVDDAIPFTQQATPDSRTVAFISQYNSDKDPAHKQAQMDKLKKENPTMYEQVQLQLKKGKK